MAVLSVQGRIVASTRDPLASGEQSERVSLWCGSGLGFSATTLALPPALARGRAATGPRRLRCRRKVLDTGRLHHLPVGGLGPPRPLIEEVGHEPEEQGSDGDVQDQREPTAAREEEDGRQRAHDPTLAPEALLVLSDSDRERRLVRITKRVRPVHRSKDSPTISAVQACPCRPAGLAFRDGGFLRHVAEVYRRHEQCCSHERGGTVRRAASVPSTGRRSGGGSVWTSGSMSHSTS